MMNFEEVVNTAASPFSRRRCFVKALIVCLVLSALLILPAEARRPRRRRASDARRTEQATDNLENIVPPTDFASFLKKSDETDTSENAQSDGESTKIDNEIPVEADSSLPGDSLSEEAHSDRSDSNEDSVVPENAPESPRESEQIPNEDTEDLHMAVHEHSPEVAQEDAQNLGVNAEEDALPAAGEADSTTGGDEPLNEETALPDPEDVNERDGAADESSLVAPKAEEAATDHAALSVDILAPEGDVPRLESLDQSSDQADPVGVDQSGSDEPADALHDEASGPPRTESSLLGSDAAPVSSQPLGENASAVDTAFEPESGSDADPENRVQVPEGLGSEDNPIVGVPADVPQQLDQEETWQENALEQTDTEQHPIADGTPADKPGSDDVIVVSVDDNQRNDEITVQDPQVNDLIQSSESELEGTDGMPLEGERVHEEIPVSSDGSQDGPVELDVDVNGGISELPSDSAEQPPQDEAVYDYGSGQSSYEHHEPNTGDTFGSQPDAYGVQEMPDHSQQNREPDGSSQHDSHDSNTYVENQQGSQGDPHEGSDYSEYTSGDSQSSDEIASGRYDSQPNMEEKPNAYETDQYSHGSEYQEPDSQYNDYTDGSPQSSQQGHNAGSEYNVPEYIAGSEYSTLDYNAGSEYNSYDENRYPGDYGSDSHDSGSSLNVEDVSASIYKDNDANQANDPVFAGDFKIRVDSEQKWWHSIATVAALWMAVFMNCALFHTDRLYLTSKRRSSGRSQLRTCLTGTSAITWMSLWVASIYFCVVGGYYFFLMLSTSNFVASLVRLVLCCRPSPQSMKKVQ